MNITCTEQLANRNSIFIGDGGNGDMVTQEDTIFVSGMNPQSSEEDIAEHFGAIGIIKVKFWSLKICVCSEAINL